MIAKKIVVGFGISVLLPLLVYYAVATFCPKPKYEDYQIKHYYEKLERANEDEIINLEKERGELEKQYEEKEKIFEKNLFFVAIIMGLISIIIGFKIKNYTIGTGLILGGIFTLIDGYYSYWYELEYWMKFISVLIAFPILIFVGHYQLSKKDKK